MRSSRWGPHVKVDHIDAVTPYYFLTQKSLQISQQIVATSTPSTIKINATVDSFTLGLESKLIMQRA